MEDKTLDDILLDAVKENPGLYAITAEEYSIIIKADFLVDSITRHYVAVNDSSDNSVLVTAATPKDIIQAMNKGGLDADKIKALTDDVLNRRKWYTTLLKVTDDGKISTERYILLRSDTDRTEIKYSDVPSMEHDIKAWAAALRIPATFKYIPSFAWNALKQISLIFEQNENTPAIMPANYSTIRQGTVTNILTKLRAIEGQNAIIDPMTGTATITKGNFTLTIPNYTTLTGLKTSTYQLLDAITIALTVTGAKSPTVLITLDDYMERRGLKDRKEAKSQVSEDMKLLRQASITGEEKRGKNTISYSFVNIADSGEVRRNGDIVFTFGSTFYKMLLGYPVMPYPAQLQTIKNKKYPNSYYLLRKITELKNMNAGKQSEDIISVKTLLGAAPYIPSYDDVMSGNRNVSERIIKPFERDLDALADTLTWEYCHSKGAPLTDTELVNMDYSIFSKLLVKIYWKDYPAEAVQKAIERREQAKAKATPKKRGRPRKNPS